MAAITISRQVASLGDEIAQSLAERLGFHLVTREETHDLAVRLEPRFGRQMERLEQEGGLSFWERLFFGQPKYTSLFAALTLEQAARGKVIILGRGAQVVLRRVPQVLRVRIVAPREVRAARVMEERNVDREEALELILQHDQARRALINQIFTHDLRNWALYHLVVNTETLDTDGGVDILEQAVRVVERLHPMEEVAKRLADMALGKRVETMVRREVLNSFQVKAHGEAGGLVRLVGSVPSPSDKEKAEDLAAGVPGVEKVVNELKTAGMTFRWPV